MTSEGELQFESVVPRTDAAASATACTICRTPFETEYFDVGGQQICRTCSEQIAYQMATPRETSTLVRAAVAGFIACILGAVVYFAVVAISGFEVGLVSIAIGYMVGYGVRLGTRGRGGRRFQVLALLLTYWAIGLAYSSLAIKAAFDKPADRIATSVSGPQESGAPALAAPATRSPAVESEKAAGGGGRALRAMLYLLAFSLVMPVLAVVTGLPGGLLTGAIIVFGMMQAWKMTAAPVLAVTGPYRIGAPAAG